MKAPESKPSVFFVELQIPQMSYSDWSILLNTNPDDPGEWALSQSGIQLKNLYGGDWGPSGEFTIEKKSISIQTSATGFSGVDLTLSLESTATALMGQATLPGDVVITVIVNHSPTRQTIAAGAFTIQLQ